MLQKTVYHDIKCCKILVIITATRLHKNIFTVMRSQFLSLKSFNYLSSVLDEVIEVCPLVTPDVSVAQAITLVCQGQAEKSKVLNAIVVENSIPIGVLTSGDIVIQISAGKNIELVKVVDAITQPLVTLTRSQIKSIECILDKFDSQIDSLVVLNENGNVEGIITKANIIPTLKNILLEHKNSIALNELAKKNLELARTTRMKDEFLANMGHELRTPLNAILGLSEGLIDEVYAPLVEKQRKAILNIQNCGRNLLDLINDILDLTKIESGELKLDKTVVDIKTLCNSVYPFVQELADKKNITLAFKIGSDINNIWVDGLRIRQVLIKLLSNGIKFTRNGGIVELVANVDKEAKQVHFQVFDTGIGIDANNFNKLFQLFVQIDASLSRSYSGTGLGLVLVKKIIDMHDGNVTVKSEVGKGSCFTVTLPLMTAPDLNDIEFINQSTFQSIKSVILAEDISNSNSLNQALNQPLNQPLILVADDNVTNSELIVEFLTVCGYQSILARDGIEAVQFATTQKPQLIIIDVQMPKLDGLAAIKRIRKVPELSKTPIIALTALSVFGSKNECIEAGADEFIPKPVKLKYLNLVIKKFLQRSQKV